MEGGLLISFVSAAVVVDHLLPSEWFDEGEDSNCVSCLQPNLAARTGLDWAIAFVQLSCWDSGMLATIAFSFESPSAVAFLGA